MSETHPEVGMIAEHKSGTLDPRPIVAVSDDATAIKIAIGSIETDWLPAKNYWFEGR